MGHFSHPGNGLPAYSISVHFCFKQIVPNLFGFEKSRDYACDRDKTDAKGIVVVVVKTPQKDTSNLKYVERMNNL